MTRSRTVLLVGLGITLGALLTAGGLLAGAITSFSMQEVMNRVLDVDYGGFRPAPSVSKLGLMHNAATITGVSSAVRADGFTKKSIQVELSGTATVQIEWRLQSGTYMPVLGCHEITVPGTKCDIVNNPAYEMRTNVIVCDACTVTTRYHFEP